MILFSQFLLTAGKVLPVARCLGIEQAIRYAAILLDIADGKKQEFDELLIERSPKGTYWLHFAVRPKDNRRKVRFIQT